MQIKVISIPLLGFPDGSDGKESVCNAQYSGSIPGSGRSPGGRHGYPFKYACLENLMDRRAWWATVRGSQWVGYDSATYTFHLSSGAQSLQEPTQVLSVPSTWGSIVCNQTQKLHETFPVGQRKINISFSHYHCFLSSLYIFLLVSWLLRLLSIPWLSVQQLPVQMCVTHRCRNLPKWN